MVVRQSHIFFGTCGWHCLGFWLSSTACQQTWSGVSSRRHISPSLWYSPGDTLSPGDHADHGGYAAVAGGTRCWFLLLSAEGYPGTPNRICLWKQLPAPACWLRYASLAGALARDVSGFARWSNQVNRSSSVGQSCF